MFFRAIFEELMFYLSGKTDNKLLQEKKLRIASKGKKTMSDNQIKNFIMFYERLTKHMLKNLYRKSGAVITIDKKHRLKSIKFK